MIGRNRWLLGGLVCLIAAAVWAYAQAHPPSRAFDADGSFATLAALLVLAPALSTANVLLDKRSRLAITDATMLRTAAHRAAVEPATTRRQENTLADRVSPDPAGPVQTAAASRATADAADAAWLEVRRTRPTLVLPAAAIATVLCAYLHLFLLHGVAVSVRDGIPASRLSFAVDALLTGLALAAGAKHFHDLADSTAASSAAKKAAATSRRLSRGPSISSGRGSSRTSVPNRGRWPTARSASRLPLASRREHR